MNCERGKGIGKELVGCHPPLRLTLFVRLHVKALLKCMVNFWLGLAPATCINYNTFFATNQYVLVFSGCTCCELPSICMVVQPCHLVRSCQGWDQNVLVSGYAVRYSESGTNTAACLLGTVVNGMERRRLSRVEPKLSRE